MTIFSKISQEGLSSPKSRQTNSFTLVIISSLIPQTAPLTPALHLAPKESPQETKEQVLCAKPYFKLVSKCSYYAHCFLKNS